MEYAYVAAACCSDPFVGRSSGRENSCVVLDHSVGHWEVWDWLLGLLEESSRLVV